MQSFLPFPQSAIGVFQNLMLLKYEAGALAWYCAHPPFWIWSMNLQALGFAGVSPNESACSACTFGVEMYLSHMYAQFGCFAFAESIQVSAHPVAPSFGIRSLTGTLSALSVFVWYGHDAPITASPFLKRSISSDASAQYFLISGFCFFSSATTAFICVWFSSYGSSIPSDGFVFIR